MIKINASTHQRINASTHLSKRLKYALVAGLSFMMPCALSWDVGAYVPAHEPSSTLPVDHEETFKEFSKLLGNYTTKMELSNGHGSTYACMHRTGKLPLDDGRFNKFLQKQTALFNILAILDDHQTFMHHVMKTHMYSREIVEELKNREKMIKEHLEKKKEEVLKFIQDKKINPFDKINLRKVLGHEYGNVERSYIQFLMGVIPSLADPTAWDIFSAMISITSQELHKQYEESGILKRAVEYVLEMPLSDLPEVEKERIKYIQNRLKELFGLKIDIKG